MANQNARVKAESLSGDNLLRVSNGAAFSFFIFAESLSKFKVQSSYILQAWRVNFGGLIEYFLVVFHLFNFFYFKTTMFNMGTTVVILTLQMTESWHQYHSSENNPCVQVYFPRCV